MSSLIEVKHLKKYYNKGEIKALDDVSVNIERGDVMVVIGPSGSGKSTLLRSLNLLEVPTAGEIDFDGVDITKKKVKNEAGKWVKLDLDKHRQKMGMVFQHFNLFPHMTILRQHDPRAHPCSSTCRRPRPSRRHMQLLRARRARRPRGAPIPSSSPAARSSAWPSSARS